MAGLLTAPMEEKRGLLSSPVDTRPSLLAYNPSFRERIGNAIYDAARYVGLPSIANRMRNEAGVVVDFVPGVGDVVGVDDAYRDYQAGNLGMAAAGLGLTAAGVVPGVGDAVAAAGKKGIRAFHGSPHDFDRFSMDKIGTGEGAQAYGHGLYFADNEDVAKSYRDSLTASRMLVDGTPFTPGNYAITQMIADSADRPDFQDILRRYIQNEKDNPYSDVEDVQKVLDSVERGTFEIPNTGRLYEVNINANPDDFLDWDKPLSEQIGVAQKLGLRIKSEKELTDEAYSMFDKYGTFDDMPPEARRRIQEINDEINRPGTTQTGREIYEFGVGRQENVHDFLSGPSAHRSDELRAAGIPGIKYLDAGSRGAGDGSRNYVVFDESLIEIVRKYGLAGAVAAGLISQQMADMMAAQGIGQEPQT